MPSANLLKLIASVLAWGLLTGCATRIPPQLAERVSWNLGYPELRRQPEAYIGRVSALGGIVTHIAATDQGYQVIVSELPLDGGGQHRPVADQPPRGMFIVLIPRRELPTDLRPGAEVTVVGEVLGRNAAPGAGVTEAVPLLEERYTRVWGPSWWPRFQIGIWGGIGI